MCKNLRGGAVGRNQDPLGKDELTGGAVRAHEIDSASETILAVRAEGARTLNGNIAVIYEYTPPLFSDYVEGSVWQLGADPQPAIADPKVNAT